MKCTPPLMLHNLYRMMRNQWKVARKRRVTATTALENLDKNNLKYVDANEFVSTFKPMEFDFSSIVGTAKKDIPKDENHPLYKEKLCFVYKDNNVLLEGLHQALVLTNTVQLEYDTLPSQTDDLIDRVQLQNQDDLVKRCIVTSCLYDAEQVKLPKRSDPKRPAWQFPRDYGISESRKNQLLCNRLLHLCGLASPSACENRAVIKDVPLSVPYQWEDDDVQLELKADVFMIARKPLSSIVDPSASIGVEPPDLTVSHPLISLVQENFYELKNVFPLKENATLNHVHTIMIHYNDTEVQNIFETPVLLPQVLGRSLMKAFTAAMAQARYTFGTSVKDLPEPVVVQCVQTDGQQFHFSVLQLNTADMTSRRHNIYWSLPPLPLYDNCSYINGVPSLIGYNPQVFKQLLAFYINS